MRHDAQSGGDGKNRLLNRREYLVAAGGGLAAALGVGTAAAGSGESDGGGPGATNGSNDSTPTKEGVTGGEANATVGGGEGYRNTVAPSDATVVVADRGELEDALGGAASGDVVYVEGGTEIDVAESEFGVPSGVTLASDRGIAGSKGGHLRTDGHPWGMLAADDDARITGLRIGGPRWEWDEQVDGGEMGIDATGTGVEVDNCELYGWGYGAVRTADDTHVHHCNVHHSSKDGTGYGVSTGSSENPVVEYNRFAHNRHSVASSDGGYTARYNYVGQGAISHVFDQHRPGGTTIEIHHNTVEVVENAWKDKKVPAVGVRGVPEDVASIHDNWFFNPEEPAPEATGEWTDEAIIQVHVDDWQSVAFENNHYGSSEPASDVGHPR